MSDTADIDEIEKRLDHDRDKPDDCKVMPDGYAADMYALIDRVRELEQANQSALESVRSELEKLDSLDPGDWKEWAANAPNFMLDVIEELGEGDE